MKKVKQQGTGWIGQRQPGCSKSGVTNIFETEGYFLDTG